ncbi:MAG: VOC family protein [Armatimonadetes bacterium]|nr:VOC family protein [Armatimonadota bacterium]
MRVGQVLETCLYAEDLEAAERFYREVLGLEVIGRMAGRHVFFRCGDAVFLVFNPDRTVNSDSGTPTHGAAGQGHVAFAVEEGELDAWRRRLRESGVAVEKEIAWEDGGYSIYFRDPAGNSVEVATPELWRNACRSPEPGACQQVDWRD